MDATRVVDFRSDTVTQPTAGMRKAMAEAEVGDDVFGDDPTVNRLQERCAKLLGKEASIFMVSGSMANQTCIRAHTEPGDEILCHADSHIYHYEAGAPFALSGCSIQLLPGEGGIFESAELKRRIRPRTAHFAQSKLVLVENTHNRGGGTIWPLQQSAEVFTIAREFGLKVHLDGARLPNAWVASGLKPTDYTQYCDTVSMCFSKGLGAPVGSIVAGSAETIHRVHRFRKMFGGGMRQVGILAAAANYALDHHVELLAQDHVRARKLAEALAQISGIGVDLKSVQTNIVYFDVPERLGTGAEVAKQLGAKGVKMIATGPQRIRAVTHLDITDDGLTAAIAVLRDVLTGRSA